MWLVEIPLISFQFELIYYYLIIENSKNCVNRLCVIRAIIW